MIWPFTTIAKLRNELRVTQGDLRLADGHLRAMTDELQAYRVRQGNAMERKQYLLDAVKKELVVVKSGLTNAENALYGKNMEFIAAQKALIKTHKALAQAQKNDTPQDATTGKFTKKAKA